MRQLDPQYRNAVEFRHSSWWRQSVYRQFKERRLIFCAVSASSEKEAWIYFDNDRDAFAIENARTLIQKLRLLGVNAI